MVKENIKKISDLFRKYKPTKLKYVLPRISEEVCIRSEFCSGLYWKVSPLIYNRLYNKNNSDYQYQPLKLVYVDPEKIQNITGRETALGAARRSNIGRSLSGNWDMCSDSNKNDHWVVPDDKFTDGVVFKSLKNRFVDDVLWTETELYKFAMDNRTTNYKWHNCITEEQIKDRFSKLDNLYNSILNKYMTQFEQVLRGYITQDYINCFLNEICVDIGRDGEILFVDGQHRLSMAKILDIDLIPVFVVIRHKKWVQDGLKNRDCQIQYHPDNNGHYLPRPYDFR